VIRQVIESQSVQTTLLEIVGVLVPGLIEKCLITESGSVQGYHYVTYGCQLAHPETLVQILQHRPHIRLTLEVPAIIYARLVFLIEFVVIFQGIKQDRRFRHLVSYEFRYQNLREAAIARICVAEELESLQTVTLLQLEAESFLEIIP